MPTLEARAVSLAYRTRGGTVLALDQVSIALGSDEFVVVLGPSGCGKTSLLNLLAGFQAPSSGSVEIDGAPVTGPGADRAVIFQNNALLPWLSVADNVAFGLRVAGMAREARRQRALDMLARVGLAEFADRREHELSGGMRQRVGLARALVTGAPFLLMDEPLGALDALTREAMQMLLLRLWGESGAGAFLITHGIEEALLLATRLIVMSPRPGRIIAEYDLEFGRRALKDGEPSAILRDQAFLDLREALRAEMVPVGATAPQRVAAE